MLTDAPCPAPFREHLPFVLATVLTQHGTPLECTQIRQQALIALEEATVVIMIVDGQAGCNALDEEIARFLRQQRVPVFLAVNKCESEVRSFFVCC